jgi:hypothetical protein
VRKWNRSRGDTQGRCPVLGVDGEEKPLLRAKGSLSVVNVVTETCEFTTLSATNLDGSEERHRGYTDRLP